MKVGIVGYRSWIGQAVRARLLSSGDIPVNVDKADAAGTLPHPSDLTMLDALLIIPGRLRPSPTEMKAEVDLVHQIATNRNAPRRQLLLGSLASKGEYAVHKQAVDRTFREGIAFRKTWAEEHDTQYTVLYPGALFGPGQPLESEMLIPSLIREKGVLALDDPFNLAYFTPIEDLCDTVVRRVTLMRAGGRFEDMRDPVPGSFALNANQMRVLYRTFTSTLRRQTPRTCNRHTDCDLADERAKGEGLLFAGHCDDDCCEDCFGY